MRVMGLNNLGITSFVQKCTINNKKWFELDDTNVTVMWTPDIYSTLAGKVTFNPTLSDAVGEDAFSLNKNVACWAGRNRYIVTALDHATFDEIIAKSRWNSFMPRTIALFAKIAGVTKTNKIIMVDDGLYSRYIDMNAALHAMMVVWECKTCILVTKNEVETVTFDPDRWSAVEKSIQDMLMTNTFDAMVNVYEQFSRQVSLRIG